MMKCSFCQTELDCNDSICYSCGFESNTEKFHENDFSKVIEHLNKLHTSKKLYTWCMEVIILGKLQEYIQRNKFTAHKSGDANYYNIKPTRRFLSKLIGWHQGDINNKLKIFYMLNSGIGDELKFKIMKSGNCNQAFRIVKEIENGITFDGFKTEEELRKKIVSEWRSFPIFNGYELKAESKHIQNHWEIDLLAFNHSILSWLIIELKLGMAYDQDLTQLSRYLGWAESNLATSDQNINGLLIAQQSNPQLNSALKNFNNITFKCYSFINNLLTLS